MRFLRDLKCLLGRHDWRRIGSAPSTLTVQTNDHVWSSIRSASGDTEHGYVHKTREVQGFVLLVECYHCPARRGYGEYAGKRETRTAAYAVAFIGNAKKGVLLKGDA